MKTREEYEKICDDTFALAGDAQANRIQIDLLLDIRDLLIWLKDTQMLKDIAREREMIAKSRYSGGDEYAVQK